MANKRRRRIHFTTVEKKQIFKSKSTVFNDFTKPDKSVLKTQSKIYDGTFWEKVNGV